jgi:ankyrin repeat protein
MCNDLFRELCQCIKINTPESFEGIQTIFKMSEMAERSELPNLSLDLSSTQTIDNLELTAAAYAAYCGNFEALKFLLSKSSVLLDAGEIPPLWCAIFRDASKELVGYLIEQGADVNQSVTAEITCGDNEQAVYKNEMVQSTPLHLAVAQNRVDLTYLLLLHNAERYAEETAQHLTPTDLAMQYGKRKLKKLFRCTEAIDLAKRAFIEANSARMVMQIAAACDVNTTFFLDYLATATHKINLNLFFEKIDPHFVLKFTEVFYFITSLDEKAENTEASYDYFRQTTLNTLKNHDPRVVENHLFSSIEEKQSYLSKFNQVPGTENFASSDWIGESTQVH